MVGILFLFVVIVVAAVGMAMVKLVVCGSQVIATGSVVSATGGMSAWSSQMGGMWLQPAQILTNSEKQEFRFQFNTQEPNVGALVLSQLPGDPTWYFEAYHNARVWTCELDSTRWKDCRVVLVRDPALSDLAERLSRPK